MSRYEEWTTVVPPAGAVKETVRRLLALAEDPAHVRSQGTGDEFLIPPYLADLLNKPKRRPRKTSSEESA